MQPLALSAASPRSIAWLVPKYDWAHLEEVVCYNCAILGGYFNIIVPVEDGGSLSEENERYPASFDPDFIILAPNMARLSKRNAHRVDPLRGAPLGTG